MSVEVENKITAVGALSNAPGQEVVQRDSAIWKGLKNGANSTSQGVSSVSSFLWSNTKAASDHTWNGLKYAGYYSWNWLSPIGGFLLRTNVDSLVQKELGNYLGSLNRLQFDGKTLSKMFVEQGTRWLTGESWGCELERKRVAKYDFSYAASVYYGNLKLGGGISASPKISSEGTITNSGEIHGEVGYQQSFHWSGLSKHKWYLRIRFELGYEKEHQPLKSITKTETQQKGPQAKPNNNED